MSVSTRAAAEWIAVRARDTSDCGAGVDEVEAAAGAGGGGGCMVGPTWQWPGAAQEGACAGRGAEEAWRREPSILIW